MFIKTLATVAQCQRHDHGSFTCAMSSAFLALGVPVTVSCHTGSRDLPQRHADQIIHRQRSAFVD